MSCKDIIGVKDEITRLKEEFHELRDAFKLLCNDFNNSVTCIKNAIPHHECKLDPEMELFHITTIGIFHSCFLTKNGTPRQPSICKYARGSLKITVFPNSFYSLMGLEQYSHLWYAYIKHVIFYFKI